MINYMTKLCGKHTAYMVHLAVILIWRIWLQSPNFMSANTDYSQAIPLYRFLLTLFAKLNVHQFALTFQFAKLNVCQMYHIYSIIS